MIISVISPDPKSAEAYETILGENEASINADQEKTILTFLETWCKKWKVGSEREPSKAEMNKIGEMWRVHNHCVVRMTRASRHNGRQPVAQ